MTLDDSRAWQYYPRLHSPFRAQSAAPAQRPEGGDELPLVPAMARSSSVLTAVATGPLIIAPAIMPVRLLRWRLQLPVNCVNVTQGRAV